MFGRGQAARIDSDADGLVDLLSRQITVGEAAVEVRQRDADIVIDPLQWPVVDQEGQGIVGAVAVVGVGGDPDGRDADTGSAK